MTLAYRKKVATEYLLRTKYSIKITSVCRNRVLNKKVAFLLNFTEITLS